MTAKIEITTKSWDEYEFMIHLAVYGQYLYKNRKHKDWLRFIKKISPAIHREIIKRQPIKRGKVSIP